MFITPPCLNVLRRTMLVYSPCLPVWICVGQLNDSIAIRFPPGNKKPATVGGYVKDACLEDDMYAIA